MEFIQAFLFTSKYILGRNGNLDIFYMFSAFALLFYMWKRHDKLKLIVQIFVPVAVVTMGMAFLYPWANTERCFIFMAKMLLNITLLVFVACNCKKWKIGRFVTTISYIHGIETFIALFLKGSSLWASEEMLDGAESVLRLRLFYKDAGAMAFASGLTLVILVYLILKEDIVWQYVLGIVIAAIDLFLSYGVGGIACAVFAIVLMLLMSSIYNKQNGRNQLAKKTLFGARIATVVAACALLVNTTYLGRINAIANGTDYYLNIKLINPLNNLSNILKQTHFLGVGFGNGNTSVALKMMNAGIAYPNSFIRIISEGGIFGIALVLISIFVVGYYCFKYGNLMSRALFIYITLYQMIGGYFTDPTNYFIYGWIIGESLNKKVAITGDCKIKLFKPIEKDKLKIAMIGDREIIGTTKKSLEFAGVLAL